MIDFIQSLTDLQFVYFLIFVASFVLGAIQIMIQRALYHALWIAFIFSGVAFLVSLR
jgi:hypothetical protein